MATLLITQSLSAQSVDIPDPNLRQVIRETLHLPDGQPIAQQEMLRLTRLDGQEKNITHLTGLEYATNVTHLYLSGNAIENLEPLAGLTNNLWFLDLYANRIQDITPLANLINLTHLSINGNPAITDITPLQGLNLIKFYYDEVCDISPTLPSARERIQSRTFPSVFAWGGGHSTLGLDHLTRDQRSALHDLDFGDSIVSWLITPTEPYWGTSTSLGGVLSLGRARHQRRLAINPNMVFLLTVGFHTTSEEHFPPGSDFLLRDENGELIRRRTGSVYINFLKPEVQDLLVKRVVAVAGCGLYDGVMIDQFVNHGAGRSHIYGVSREEMIQAFLNIFKAIREQVRDDFLILINTNRSKATRYAEYVNGTFMEAGHDYEYLSNMPGGFNYDGLKEIESTLSWSEENLRAPQINCLEGWGIPAEPPDSPENQRWMRAITTLSLTHSDGYVMYATGWGSVAVCPECPYQWGPAHEHIWYDFWDTNLGQPIGTKAQHYQNTDGLFIREFTNGWAVYNRSGATQSITLREEVIGVSSEESGTTHLLPDLDGEIYLKAPNPADVNRDGRGRHLGSAPSCQQPR